MGCSTVKKIVIEMVIGIGMEETRLFQCKRFHYAENRQSPSRFFREVTSTRPNQYIFNHGFLHSGTRRGMK